MAFFPYGPDGAPKHVVCNMCGEVGWGPMLKDEVWNKIKPEPKFNFRRMQNQQLLCTVCMELRLGRSLTHKDLMEVPMNLFYMIALINEELHK